MPTKSDVVVGSRFLRQESLADWNLFRKFLTHLGHFLTRHVLQRALRRDRRLPLVPFGQRSTPYFQAGRIHGLLVLLRKPLYPLPQRGTRSEVPIALPKRTYGHSKMRVSDALASLRRLLALYLRSFHYKARLRELPAPAGERTVHAGS